MQPLVDIVLSTYNGNRYLSSQIESIIGQTFTDWRLIIRDDGSTDNTQVLIDDFVQKDSRIVKLSENNFNVGITASYEMLLKESSAKFIALCDQDDIWKEEKLSVCLNSIGEAALFQHNAEIIDESGSKIGLLSDFTNFDLKKPILFLRPNFVGCCMFLRSEIKDKLLPFPPKVAHDTWIGLVASGFGKVCYVREPLICYRRHGQAASGIARETPSLYERIKHLGTHLSALGIRKIQRAISKKI